MEAKVEAKVTGYHPASGLHLEAGDSYTINDDDFSDEVFTRVGSAPVHNTTEEEQ